MSIAEVADLAVASLIQLRASKTAKPAIRDQFSGNHPQHRATLQEDMGAINSQTLPHLRGDVREPESGT